MMRSSRVFLLAVAALASVCAYAGLDGSHVLPQDHEAIGYGKEPPDDAVTRLEKRIAAGETKLEYDPTFGYLLSVLKELKVPSASQILVYSKTSFQAPRISPRMPRALYFNDDVSVGFVRGGDVVEVTAVDPRQGVMFYTIDQEKRPSPRFDRQDQCLQCHAAGSTLGIPGLLIRSVYPDRNGMPIFQAGSFITDHRSPLKERWGGWYVTGTHGQQRHLGNEIFSGPDQVKTYDGSDGANVTDLSQRIDTGAYLEPTSDIVALMMVEHQTRMTNLIIRVGWETRIAMHDREVMNKALGDPPGTMTESTLRRIHNAADELVKYMLFTDETALTSEVKGNSAFAAEYSKLGPRDSKGRSLRELDLKTRLLKYPCSPLIYSEAFRDLPEIARNYIYKRLREVLTGQDKSKDFARLSDADRAAVLEILEDTKVLPSS
jgi:hypothetical protein